MSAVTKVFRAISPQPLRTSSPNVKFKISNQHTPTNHKHHGAHKRIGSSYYLSPGGLHSIAVDSEVKKLKFQLDQQPCDVSSKLSVHISQNSPGNERNSVCHSLPSYSEIPDFNQIPLSPSMFDCSPLPRSSPNYQRANPCEYLYTPDRKESCLGRGSFGNVRLCKYQNHQFALKVVPCSKTAKIGEKNFVGLRHKNLVRILKVFELKKKVFVCMEFAGHSNLQQLLDDKTDLDFIIKLSFAVQISAGLNHCHQLKIAHGDVKPLNVIVSPEGVCKLGDFGLSVQINSKSPKKTTPNSSFAGTAAYAAPEVLKGMPLSLEADIYSLGVTVWQVYTRETPFAGEHPHIIIYKVVSRNVRPVLATMSDSLTEEYMNICIKCWDRDPIKRPTSESVLMNLKNQLKNTKV